MDTPDSTSSKISIQEIAKCLYIINKKAKYFSSNEELYAIKHKVIDKLLHDGKATKIGLHKVKVPSQKVRYETLIQVENYLFHLPPTAEDLEELRQLGPRSTHRNPTEYIPLTVAKETLLTYINYDVPDKFPKKKKPKKENPFISTYLGKIQSKRFR